MRIRLVVERVCLQLRGRLLTSKLDQMAEELGPVSFRTPAFLDAEMKLALAMTGLAAVEYEIGETRAAERASDRAEQIFMALRRFLPNAELDETDRKVLEKRMEKLKAAVAKLAAVATAA